MNTCKTHKSCIDTALYKAEAVCLKRGLRFTSIRRKVLEIIWHSHDPIKAYDILDQLKHKNPSAKPATVYRALDFLLQNGLVHKLNSRNSYVGCYHPLKHSDCYFLICDKCGEASECCNNYLAEAISRIANENQFQLQHTTLEIEGRCKNCGSVANT